MLIIGTVIGAGFASGREIVSFFGTGIPLLAAPVCGLGIFALCSLYLWLGSTTGARNVSELNVKLMGRFHFIPDSFLLLNSLIVLSGMLAGCDSLGGMFLPLSPLYSIAAGCACAFVVHKGLSGIMKCNCVIVPLIIFSLVLVCVGAIRADEADLSLGNLTALIMPVSAVYVSMNMILASTVLTTLGKLTRRQILVPSALAAAMMTVLMTLIILMLNSCPVTESDMPVLSAAASLSPWLYGLIAAIIGVSIFTTMLTAMSGLCAWFSTVFGNGIYCPIIVLLAGILLSRLGFNKVVSLLYPVIGVLGLLYIAIGVIYALRTTAAVQRLSARFTANKRVRRRKKSRV